MALSADAYALETAGPKSLTTTGMNALGFAGWNGEVNTWWDVGVVEISPNWKIPIRFNFNSAQEKVGNSILGWNWWMPLMESNVVKDSENHLFIHMPGGKRLDLWKSAQDPFLFKSPDHQWEGRVDDHGNFKVKNNLDGINLNFFKGKLMAIHLATGEGLEWDYDSLGKPKSIKDTKGNQLLRVNYDQMGFLEAIEFQGVGREKQSIRTKVDSIATKGGQPVPVLIALDASDNNTKTFRYEQDAVSLSLITDKQVGEELVPDDYFKWSLLDGKILQAEGMNYDITIKEDNLKRFSRSLPSGTPEVYTYDQKTGIATLVEDGKTVERAYINSNGPNFSKIRKVTRTSAGRKEVEKLSYAANGNLLRHTISNDEKFEDYQYDSEGDYKYILKNMVDHSDVKITYKNGIIESIIK